MRDASKVLRDIDENRSVWITGRPPHEPQPALASDTTCDVVIVGGGFTGVSTAWHLSQRFPDLGIVLLEARALANGGSGRNGGLVLNWVVGVEAKDPEHAKLVFDATREGIDLIEGIVRENALDAGFRRDGTLDVFTDRRRADAAAKRVEKLNAAGIPLRFLHGAELAPYTKMEGVHGAIFDPTTGHLNGADYVRALGSLLLRRGVRIFEGTPVFKIEEGETITVRTPGGEVRARALVLATNAYTPRLGYFRNGIVPLHSHAIATEPLSRDAWSEIGLTGTSGFADDLDRIAYASMTAEGQLVFGGGSNAAYSYVYGGKASFRGTADSSHRAVHHRFLKYFPRAKDVKVTHRWTGPVAVTMSRICTMGVRGHHRNVYYAVGFSGHGITLANLAGRVLTDIYSGSDERWRPLPFYQQKTLPIPPEPFRWMGYQVVTKLTGKSPRRTR